MLYHFELNGLNESEFFHTPKESKKKLAIFYMNTSSSPFAFIVMYKCLIIWIEIGRAIFDSSYGFIFGHLFTLSACFQTVSDGFRSFHREIPSFGEKKFPTKMLRCMWFSCVRNNFIYQNGLRCNSVYRDLIKQFHVEMKQSVYTRDKRSKRIVWLITNCLMVGNRLKLQNNYRWFVCVLTQQRHNTHKITRYHAK